MRRLTCKVCLNARAVPLQVTVSRKGAGARTWHIQVCQDCWRVWESLLDEGAVGIQQGLDELPIGHRGWFW